MPRNFRRTTCGTPESCISASNIIHGVLKRKESAAHRCTTDPRPQVVGCDYRSVRMSKGGHDEVVFPEECCPIRSPSFRFACTDVFVCLQLDKVPHECVPLPSDQPRLRPYYFDAVDRHRVAPRIHDGAGTTGSSLRGKRYHYVQRGSFTRCHDSRLLISQPLKSSVLVSGKSRWFVYLLHILTTNLCPMSSSSVENPRRISYWPCISVTNVWSRARARSCGFTVVIRSSGARRWALPTEK